MNISRTVEVLSQKTLGTIKTDSQNLSTGSDRIELHMASVFIVYRLSLARVAGVSGEGGRGACAGEKWGTIAPSPPFPRTPATQAMLSLAISKGQSSRENSHSYCKIGDPRTRL